jgi:hypothetical protein
MVEWAHCRGECKNTDSLYLADVHGEVDKATAFPGGLAEFYIVASGDSDAALQREVRECFKPDSAVNLSLGECWKGPARRVAR